MTPFEVVVFAACVWLPLAILGALFLGRMARVADLIESRPKVPDFVPADWTATYRDAS